MSTWQIKFILFFLFTKRALFCTDDTLWNCRFSSSKTDFLRHHNKQLTTIKHKDQPVPKNFDARIQWPKCASISKIINQGTCQISWAISTTMAASDRWCIASKTNSPFEFSIQSVASCCRACITVSRYNICGSRGGYQDLALDYIKKQGVVSEACNSLDIKKLQKNTTQCENFCNVKNNTKIKIRDFGYFKFPFFNQSWRDFNISNHCKQIQIDMMKNGPVTAMMYVTDHFVATYNNSGNVDKVYRAPKKETFYPHGVRIIGWGEDSGTPYWLIANSWGKNWARDGFFKLIRGRNEQFIEGYVHAIINKNEDILETEKPEVASVSTTLTQHFFTFILIPATFYLK